MDRIREEVKYVHRNTPHLKYCPNLYLCKLFLGLPVASEGDAGCGPAVPIVVHPLPLPLPSNNGCWLFWSDVIFVVGGCAHAVPKIVYFQYSVPKFVIAL